MNARISAACLGITAMLCVTLSAATRAATPSLEDLKNMPPELRNEQIKALVTEQEAESSAIPAVSAAVAAVDTTPPVVTAFNAESAVTTKLAVEQLLVSLTVTDDASGVQYGWVDAVSPSGRWVSAWFSPGGTKNFIDTLPINRLGPFSESGEWHIVSVSGYDVAGNWFYADETTLAALGNTTFTVTSPFFDATPPVLVSGRIETRVVSLSDPNPLVRVMAATKDPLSGVAYVSMYFCLEDDSTCMSGLNSLYLGGSEDPIFRRAAANRIWASNDLSWNPPVPGTYVLREVWVADSAGNSAYYLSTAIGGDTDFSLMFPTTTIVVKP